jgi:hypothetical protein
MGSDEEAVLHDNNCAGDAFERGGTLDEFGGRPIFAAGLTEDFADIGWG